MSEKKKVKKIGPFIIASVLVIVLVIAYIKIQYARKHEETDDAQIEGNISPVAARIGGYITDIRVVENQKVMPGDTLVCLDNRDLLARLAQAEAALENAKAAVGGAQAGTATAQSTVVSGKSAKEAAQVRVWQTKQEFNRFLNLRKEGVSTQQQFDAAKAAATTKEARQAARAAMKAAVDAAKATVPVKPTKPVRP